MELHSWPVCAGQLLNWQCCTQGCSGVDGAEIEVVHIPAKSVPGDLEEVIGADRGSIRGLNFSTRAPPTMAELLQALKAGGGVEDSPGADKNIKFCELLNSHLPELRIYYTGKIQTSPGVEEIEGSPTEYYRTVGALIGLIACYATSMGDDFGMDCVSKGARGPMSLDKVPGKFINMGAKPDQYKQFCDTFAEGMANEDDWWAMFVFLAVHDVGKSDAFRNAVNVTLEKAQQSDDHDRALARALADIELKEKYLPSVMKLSPKRQEMLASGFATNFQLPQLGQGEIAVVNLKGLLDLPKEQLYDGTLRNYLYHSIFDIAGTGSNENFIFPIALVPVYMGFGSAMQDIIVQLRETTKPDAHAVYFKFLYSVFKKANPEFEEQVFRPMCESKIFRDETGLAVLRILALTRNTYKNPHMVLTILASSEFSSFVQELAGNPSPPGPQIMLYYAPDMLRMGLGEDLTDTSGENMLQALRGLDCLHRAVRLQLKTKENTEVYQYQLNVQPIVTVIKEAGKGWSGGKQLFDVCVAAEVKSNTMKTEGIVKMGPVSTTV